MSLQTEYPHIEERAGEPPRLQRHPRVRVAQIVMDYLAHGWSAEEICRQYPTLTPAEVHAAMAYYFDHQNEIDKEIQSELAQIAKDRSLAASSSFLNRMRSTGRI